MIPDAETLAVHWARNTSAIATLVGGPTPANARIATRLRKDWNTSALRIFAIPGGTVLIAEGPGVATSILQFDAFAKSSGQSPDYAAASLLARTAHAAAFDVRDYFATGLGMLIDFGSITVPRRVDEPDAKWARFTFEATAAIRSIA